jgi:release factor glutamine methyltransferase
VGGILSTTADYLAKKGASSPRLDAELLLGRVLSLPRVKLYVSFERELSTGELDLYRELVRRRSRLEPVAYILGAKEFFSLNFQVTRDTLIPRPETELLVDEALSLAGKHPDPPALSFVDVGTGCGAVAAALAANLPEASAEATDISAKALEVARRNLDALGLERVSLSEGNLMEAPLTAQSFDLVCANLPYVHSAAIPSLPPDVRDFEPFGALDGGPDGLDLYRRLFPQAAGRLKPGGALIVECQPGQFPALDTLAKSLGLVPRPPVTDLAGRMRIFSAAKP